MILITKGHSVAFIYSIKHRYSLKIGQEMSPSISTSFACVMNAIHPVQHLWEIRLTSSLEMTIRFFEKTLVRILLSKVSKWLLF